MRSYFGLILLCLSFLSTFPQDARSLELALLGIDAATVTPKLVKAEKLEANSGLIVRTVKPGSSAETAGLKPNDIIVAFAGIPVGDIREAEQLLATRTNDGTLEFLVIRGSTEISLVAALKDKISGPNAAKEADDLVITRGGLDAKNSYALVRVFYATDRGKTGQTSPGDFYGSDRQAGDVIHYGHADVSIPHSHTVGALEAPSLIRFEINEDPNKHVILKVVQEQSPADFYKDVNALLAKSDKKRAFIFVHGYNVSFKDAARRTAQMAYDLKFNGVPAFFSWPSQGRYLGYPVDEVNVEFARKDLATFVNDFAASSGAEELYLIAHSMGNRALTGALRELNRDSPEAKSKIKEVILAAPDIDSDVFKRDIAPALSSGQTGQNITLYASSNDWALKASKKWHGYPRAGDSGDQIVVVPDFVTIDASGVDTGMLGHTYFAESTSIIADIGAILSGVTAPSQRMQLVEVKGKTGTFWKFVKPK